MTPPLPTVTGTHDVLAGFELSPGAVGLGGGYAIMLRCGQAWFRWTVVPVLPLVALASVVR